MNRTSRIFARRALGAALFLAAVFLVAPAPADAFSFHCGRHGHNDTKNCGTRFADSVGGGFENYYMDWEISGHRHGGSGMMIAACMVGNSGGGGECKWFSCSGDSCGEEYGGFHPMDSKDSGRFSGTSSGGYKAMSQMWVKDAEAWVTGSIWGEGETTHFECRSNACVEITGAGSDSCSSNGDCYAQGGYYAEGFYDGGVCAPDQWYASECARCNSEGTGYHPGCTDWGPGGSSWCACELRCTGENGGSCSGYSEGSYGGYNEGGYYGQGYYYSQGYYYAEGYYQATYNYTICTPITGPGDGGDCVTVTGNSPQADACAQELNCAQPPPACTFTGNPTRIVIPPSSSATLTWNCKKAHSGCTLTGAGSVPVSGSRQVTPLRTTTYTLDCTGAGGTSSNNVIVRVFDSSGGAIKEIPPQ